MLIGHPSSGVTWSYTNGAIISIDPASPAAGQLKVGERVLAVDGIPVYEARSLPNRQAGERVSFTIQRQGQPASVMILLVKPTLSELANRLSIIPIALTFWLLGMAVLAFGQADRLVHLFFIFCQSAAALLGLGAISSFGPLWAWWGFGLLLWWIGPITFHTHLALSSAKRIHIGRKTLIGIYSAAFLFSLFDLNRLRLGIAGPLLTFKYLWVGVFIIASAGLMVSTLLWDPSAENRRRTSIAGISAITSCLPVVFLSLVPDALSGKFILRYEITFLALLLLPMGYSYSILSHRLVKMEREISQSAAYALATFIVITLYAFIYIFCSSYFFLKSKPYSIFEILLVVSLALMAHPIHQFLYRWLYLAFYGGWFDDREAVKRIFEDLKQVKGHTYSIAETLCQTLQRTMLLDYANLLLSDGRLATSAKDQKTTNEVFSTNLQAISGLFNTLQEKTGRELGSGDELKEILATLGIEAGALLGLRPQLWLLFGGISNWQGLLVLGPKRGRGDFDTKDLEILEVVLRQAGAALENERLLEEVRQRSDQIRELNRKARWTLEVERKRIARDLHDMVIQTLVGINFQLANIRARNDPESSDELRNIRNNLHESLVELRGICADLRPPALDALGLVPALEARVTEIKSQVAFEIYLKNADLSAYEIPDETALCVYRFVQEALLNIQKHSGASLAIVNLAVVRENWLQITIEDNGGGFSPPKILEELVAEQHYGLVGLQEQIDAVGGEMAIDSAPGKGCRLEAWIPLRQGQDTHQTDHLKIEEESRP